MQAQLTEFGNSNKILYQQLYEKLQELGINSESDFKNIVEVSNQVPNELTDQDKKQLTKLLSNIELRLRTYENELDKIENRVLNFEKNSELFLKSFQTAKGAVLLTKNSLIQSTTDQLNMLKDGYATIKDALINLSQLLGQLESLTGTNEHENERIKKIVKENIKEEKEAILKYVNDNLPKITDVDLINVNNKVGGAHEKIDSHEKAISNIKTQLETGLSDIKYQIRNLETLIESINDKSYQHKTNIESIDERLNEELGQLKFELGSRFKHIDKTLADNLIKRY